MDISTYAERLRHEVAAATALGGDEAAAAAERMLLALDPAVRLTLMEALSDAAAEISAELPEGSVEVRMRGRDVELVVDTDTEHQRAPWVTPQEGDQDQASADLVRLTLRLPPDLKTRAEDAATRAGQSLNSWLVAAVRSATLQGRPDLGPTAPTSPSQPRVPGRHVTGWA
jgi:predicted HicB family RNase H-like nuclease